MRGMAVACCVCSFVIRSASAAPALLADPPPTKTTSAVRITAGLTDEVWRAAPPTSEFLQREPKEGAEPTQRTEFRVAYDASTLYVRVRAFDSEPDKIVGYLTRRDDDSPSDWVHVFIDSYHDRRTAYEFAVNPVGVKADRYWFDDTNDDKSWDAVWDVSVSRDAGGWRRKTCLTRCRQRRWRQLSLGAGPRYKSGCTSVSGWPICRRIDSAAK